MAVDVNFSQNLSSVDLTSCDREQIQLINSIQPIGFLIAVSSDWIITHASGNAGGFLGFPMNALLGESIQDVFRKEVIDVIRNVVSEIGDPDTVERMFGVQLRGGGSSYDLAIHISGKTVIIEGELHKDVSQHKAGAMIRSMLLKLKKQDRVMPEAARLMQALTGFDRVMVYRFHPDGSGEVIAEKVLGKGKPFLGLRYPASDILVQARALLIRNRVRYLADVHIRPIPLMSINDPSSEPIDLSTSTLRAHSMMHIEYLSNRGASARRWAKSSRPVNTVWGLARSKSGG